MEQYPITLVVKSFSEFALKFEVLTIFLVKSFWEFNLNCISLFGNVTNYSFQNIFLSEIVLLLRIEYFSECARGGKTGQQSCFNLLVASNTWH